MKKGLMSNQNRVAVVDDEEFLPQAVATVVNAGRADIEVVVVYDSSTDERTREEAERLAAQGIKVLRQENNGLAARNAGMSAAWAEYIFPLDADDRMRTDFARELTHVAGGRRDGE